jgi:hypothetical protein
MDYHLPVDASRLSMVWYVPGDDRETFELWLLDLKNHPYEQVILQYALTELKQMLKEINYDVLTLISETHGQWTTIGPGHKILPIEGLFTDRKTPGRAVSSV